MTTNLKLFIFLFVPLFTWGQNHPSDLFKVLPKGKHEVGFHTLETWDYSRTYQFQSGEIPWRPMQIAIWFPNKQSTKDKLSYLDYIKLSTRSERLLVNDSLAAITIQENTNRKELQDYMSYPLLAGFAKLPMDDSDAFPLILYAPGSSAHWYENALLAERLASYGYIVMACKSRGLKSPLMSMDWEGVEAQTRDLEFMMGIAHQYPFIKLSQTHLIGRSWGAIAAVVGSIRNQNIKSITSLDGTISYNAMMLMEDSPYPGGEHITCPILLQVGKNRSPQATPIDRKHYFSDVQSADAYAIEYTHMPHVGFSSYYLMYHYLSKPKLSKELKVNLIKAYALSIQHLIQFLRSQNQGKSFQLDSDEVFSFDRQIASHSISFDHNDFSFYLETLGWESTKKEMDKIKAVDAEFDFSRLFSPSYLNSYAYKLQGLGILETSIEILEWACEHFPEHANLFDSLGEMFYHQKNWAFALENYKKSLALNPDNSNAEKMIALIQKEKE